MRIRTQLFGGTAALVLGLVGVQWWLQARQLQALERKILEMAASMGENLLSRSFAFSTASPASPGTTAEVHKVVLRTDSTTQIVSGAAAAVIELPPLHDVEKRTTPRDVEERITTSDVEERTTTGNVEERITPGDVEERTTPGGVEEPTTPSQTIEVRVEAKDEGSEHFLVIHGKDKGADRKVPIPVSGSVSVVRDTMNSSLLAGVVLLLAGLLGSALLARKVAGPLRRLAEGAEAVGQGRLGMQVARQSTGELGELEAAFNHMSSRLAELEAEKQAWLAREHLAELGDLARGLGHGLRNPLHTLGLSVEELARARDPEELSALAATARAQIRRIDRGLRSFLAVGAGHSVAPELVELGTLVEDLVLESAQQGQAVIAESCPEPLPVRAVAPALRSALANLVANAVEASPRGEPVTVALRRAEGEAILEIADRGPGLAPEVRERLYSPHVTTKPEGAGMGLFLTRQILEGGQVGTLELLDRPGGGTLARVRLPLAAGAAA